MRALTAAKLHLALGLFVLIGVLHAKGATTSAAPATVYDDRAKVIWQKGPGTAKLKQTATLNLPQGFRFADAHSTMRLLRTGKQPVTEREMGMIVPEEGDWSMLFIFDDIGYMNDSGANSLELNDLLQKLNRLAQAEHAELKAKGPAPKVTWEQKPAYKVSSHMLDWAVRSETAMQTNLQYQARFLGRKGVMSVKLEGDIELINSLLPSIKEMLGSFVYKPGERYSDIAFRDRLARGNLEGLITGKAASQGSKVGFVAGLLLFLKKLLKLLLTVVIIAAIAGAVWAGYFFYKIYYGRGKPKSEAAG